MFAAQHTASLIPLGERREGRLILTSIDAVRTVITCPVPPPPAPTFHIV